VEAWRVRFFAQELRTPQPVRIKRLEKARGAIELLKEFSIYATQWHNFSYAPRLQNPSICQMDA
jgi:hypothetical protein